VQYEQIKRESKQSEIEYYKTKSQSASSGLRAQCVITQCEKIYWRKEGELHKYIYIIKKGEQLLLRDIKQLTAKSAV
jgi:hypothetical protein